MSRISRAWSRSSRSSVCFVHGSSTSHSRYVRWTVYSADDCAICLRRSSCLRAVFSTSAGISAALIFSSKASRSLASSPSPSSSWIALSFWRSTASRWCLENSSRTCESIFCLTLMSSTLRCEQHEQPAQPLGHVDSRRAARRAPRARDPRSPRRCRRGAPDPCCWSSTCAVSSGMSGEMAMSCLATS